MTHHIVKFFKTVTGDNGHVAEVRQFEQEVLAKSRLEAEATGIRQFCDEQGLSSGSLLADRISVEEAEFPSWCATEHASSFTAVRIFFK